MRFVGWRTSDAGARGILSLMWIHEGQSIATPQMWEGRLRQVSREYASCRGSLIRIPMVLNPHPTSDTHGGA